MSLIEKAQQNFDQKKAQELEKKMRSGKLTLTDFYDQLCQLKGMGSMADIAAMIPGAGGKALQGAQVDEKQLAPYERDNPEVLNFSRKKRIAAGCGLKVEDVNRLLKQFNATQQLMKQFSGAAKRKGKGLRGLKLPF